MVYTLSGVRLPAVPSTLKLGTNVWNTDRSARVSLFFKNKSNFRKICSGKSYESGSQSSMATTSEKVPENDGTSPPSEELEVPETVSDNSQVEDQENIVELLSSSEAITVEDSASVQLPDGDVEAEAEGTSVSTYETISDESTRIRGKIIPPPGIGQRIYEIDPMLTNHRQHLDYRYDQYRKLREAIDKNEGGLELFSRGYEKFGFNRRHLHININDADHGNLIISPS